MPKPYIARLVIDGYCPECDPGKPKRVEVTIGQMIATPSGGRTAAPLETVSAEKAAAMGFDPSEFLGGAAAQAMRERDAAQAEARRLSGELEAAVLAKKAAEERAKLAERKHEATKAAAAKERENIEIDRDRHKKAHQDLYKATYGERDKARARRLEKSTR